MKKSKEAFEVLCNIIKAETERYKNEYDRLKSTRKEAVEKIKSNYVPNTPLYQEELKKVEERFVCDVSVLKSEYSANVSEAIEKVRETELARVQTVNETKLAKIKAIADIPMTTAELLAVAERYEIENDYWCNRVLHGIAEKNGIDGFDTCIEASYTTKTNILNQLADQTAEMIRDYDGTDQRNRIARQRTRHVLLSDSVLNRGKELWNGINSEVPDSEAISKAYITVRSKHSDIEKGLAIANILKNAKGEKRNMLLCQFAEDNDISEFAFNLSGFGTELIDFRKGKAAEYRKARKVMEELQKENSTERKKEIISRNSSNPFLNKIIETEAKRNMIFEEFAGMKANESNNDNTV